MYEIYNENLQLTIYNNTMKRSKDRLLYHSRKIILNQLDMSTIKNFRKEMF